jgi:hypothetical protein
VEGDVYPRACRSRTLSRDGPSGAGTVLSWSQARSAGVGGGVGQQVPDGDQVGTADGCVRIVVGDLAAATAFFVKLGRLELTTSHRLGPAQEKDVRIAQTVFSLVSIPRE